MSTDERPRLGRPPVTTHGHIEHAAFALFDTVGFEDTTIDAIAEAAGIGRRTLFRYFPSKNDIPWGRFDASLADFRATLGAMPAELPTAEAVHRAVIEFNRFDPAALPQHRRRMRLLLTTPALQAHSVLRYAQWRQVIAEHVATRSGQAPDDLLPRTVGHVSLAVSLSAYEQWLRDDDAASLTDLLDAAFTGLRGYLR